MDFRFLDPRQDGPRSQAGLPDLPACLGGKTILIVQGSLLAGSELEEVFQGFGAHVYLASGVTSAFELLRRMRFDGAVIDRGLHNAAVDLCSELQELGIPYMFCAEPHRLQRPSLRPQDAE